MFDRLEELVRDEGIDAALEALVDRLSAERQYAELFEALKMRVRHELGLPLIYSDRAEDLPAEKQTRLEDGLFAACRRVGMMLLEDGRIREGWMYMRPVGDRTAVAEAIGRLEVTDENVDEHIDVLLHEGVAPARGYDLVLDRYGTCNAITVFESAMHHHSKAAQSEAASLLLRHVHDELLASVTNHIREAEGAAPQGASLPELVENRDWMFGEHSYHIDTTHLASTVRIARLCTERGDWELARGLTAYGRRLHAQFQYQGDPPFTELYPSHARYFEALLGIDPPAAVDYFRSRAEAPGEAQGGTLSVEVYVDLLSRMGRPDEALREALRLVTGDLAEPRHVPWLLALAAAAGNYDALVDFCRRREDLLGFAIAVMERRGGMSRAGGGRN